MDTGSPRWCLRLFGDFQLSERVSGEKVALPGKRERVLLAYLALSPNGRQPRRKLVTLLWGEAADETTLENLRTSIFNLRKALGDAERSIIASEDRDIVLDASVFEVDILEFRRLSACGTTSDLEQAAMLYAGDFLEGLSIESEEYESWRREESTRCKGQVLDALTKLMGQLAASGESERAIDTGLRILRLEPLHEEGVRRLMRLYAENGRRTAGIELYKTLAESLRKELSAQPEAQTRAVYAEIVRGGEERTGVPPADAKPTVPFPTVARPSDPYQHLAIEPTAAKARPAANRGKIGWLAAAGLAAVAAAAVLIFMQVGPSTTPASSSGAPTVVAATPTSAIALAVLPFANLSSEPNQDFFSDGLTDEITSTLARVHDLRIVARTSAFEFKGQNRNIRTIGEQLGATHLIEGSVRRAGDRVRIAVQLIEAESGVNVWTNSYDRELTDVLAIQEDIATAISAALRVPLGLQPNQHLTSGHIPDAALYDNYLRAKALMRARGFDRLSEAARLLEPVVAREPEFAPALAMLGQVYVLQVAADPATRNDSEEARGLREAYFDKAERAAREAIRLDSQNAFAYTALARVQERRGRWAEADDLHKQALVLDPGEPDAQNNYIFFLANTGQLKEAVNRAERLRDVEPFVPIYATRMATIMQQSGQVDASIPILEALPPDTGGGGFNRNTFLAQAYAEQGRYGDAADTLLLIDPSLAPRVEDSARLLRSAPTPARAPESLPVLGPGFAFVYAHVGAHDRVVGAYERALAGGFNPGTLDAWLPAMAPMRKTERFKAYVRKAGLVDYWRERGWPDLCRPVGADDFVCE